MELHLITIGDELLIGQVVDTNAAWIGQQMNLIGRQVSRITSVPDDPAAIKAALAASFSEVDLVFMTGGLGPTKDDITKKALAEYYGVGFVFSQETFDRIVGYFHRTGREATQAHREQCLMPQNAELLSNDLGSAPGMWFEEGGKVLVSMPGVPYEMKHLILDRVLPKLGTAGSGQAIFHRTLRTVGREESMIAEAIDLEAANLPKHIKLAYLPSLGQVRLRLSGVGPDPIRLRQEVMARAAEIEKKVTAYLFGYDEESLETAIGRLLVEQKARLATAESCTGGHLAHRITSVPGASGYFQGSVIAYANKVKIEQLKVRPETLATEGAVSEACIREMVAGCLDLFGTDYAIATSGIAGPDGGTPEKPVGTIWIAAGSREETRVRKLSLGRDRQRNIQMTTVFALDLLRQLIKT